MQTRYSGTRHCLESSESRWRGALSCWLLFVSAACAVDDRTLLELDCPEASEGGTAGSAGKSGSGAGQGGAPKGPCADLDMNEVPDCDETLVLNATFDENTEHWSPEEGVQIDWNSTDAQTVQSSGSLVVTNEFVADTNEYVTRAATQCIPVEGFKVYALFAEALIEAEEVRGFALLGAWFYDGPDCVGAASLAITPRTGTLRRWTTLGQRFTSQATAKSLLVRLGVAKPYSQSEPVTVRFDNVLVRRE